MLDRQRHDRRGAGDERGVLVAHAVQERAAALKLSKDAERRIAKLRREFKDQFDTTVVAHSTGADAGGTLNLGLSNAILAGEFIARDKGTTGLVEVLQLDDGSRFVWIEDLGLAEPERRPLELMTGRQAFVDALRSAWRQEIDDDGFNRLVLRGATEGTSHIDTGLTAGTTYDYRVRACDAADNCSGLSSPSSAVTHEADAPSTLGGGDPLQITGLNVTTDRRCVEVSWATSQPADSLVEYGTAP